MRMCLLSHSVESDSLRPHGLYVACQAPLSMEFSFASLQTRILEWVSISSPTQGSNTGLLHLLHWQVNSSPLSYLESPTWEDVSLIQQR